MGVTEPTCPQLHRFIVSPGQGATNNIGSRADCSWDSYQIQAVLQSCKINILKSEFKTNMSWYHRVVYVTTYQSAHVQNCTIIGFAFHVIVKGPTRHYQAPTIVGYPWLLQAQTLHSRILCTDSSKFPKSCQEQKLMFGQDQFLKPIWCCKVHLFITMLVHELSGSWIVSDDIIAVF